MRFSALLLLALGLAACASDDDGAFSYAGPVADADWSTTPSEHRGADGDVFAYQCPKNPGASGGSIWGTEEYTDDSSVCMAGVHAGAISFQDGGQVVIEIRPGKERYTGTEANGVATGDWGGWDGGFVVLQ